MSTIWDLDAIGRMYDEEKANIASALPQELADPWPETEEIDVATIAPPPAPQPHEAPAAPLRPWYVRLLASLRGS